MGWRSYAGRLLGAVMGATIFGLAWCTAVTSLTPVGSQITSVEPEIWGGIWTCPGFDLFGSEVFSVAVTDEEAGELSIALVVRKRELGTRHWELVEIPAVVRRGPGDLRYLSLRFPVEKASSSYVWALMRDDLWRDRSIVIWLPHPAVLKRLVEQGRITGEYRGHSEAGVLEVRLDDKQLEAMAPLTGEEGPPEGYIANAFAWEFPVTCNRLTDGRNWH